MSDEIALVKILTFYLPSNQNFFMIWTEISAHTKTLKIAETEADTTTENFQLLTYTMEALDMTYNTITQNIFVI